MLSQLALFGNILLVAWLLARDRKLYPMPSKASWLTLLWILIIGSRYISAWFGVDTELDSPDDLLEGSLLDRNIFLLLIICGAVTLFFHRPVWGAILKSNRWFLAFFVYCGISIMWSDYPFVSLKRYTKEIGNVIMALIILTEKDPVQAIRAIFARYVHLVIPFSIVLIYCFPSIGTYYDASLLLSYCGVATNKNKLGVITFVSGLFLVWELIHIGGADGKKPDWPKLYSCCALLLMVVWLTYIAHSATALVCIIVGTGMLFLMKFPFFVRNVGYLGIYSLMLAVSMILLLYSFPNIIDAVPEMMGRDKTLTGRTDLWIDLLREPINPILGTGYQSFWLGTRTDDLWDKYLFHPTQAHNGYLETYLNGGLVGVGLLLAMIVATASKLKKVLLLEKSFGILLIVFILTAVLYNCTEAMISRLSLLWFVICIAALYSPAHHSVVAGIDKNLEKKGIRFPNSQ